MGCVLYSNIGYVYELCPKVEEEERQDSHPVWIFLHSNIIHLEGKNASALFLASSFGQHYTFYISIIRTTVWGMAPDRMTPSSVWQCLCFEEIIVWHCVDFYWKIMPFLPFPDLLNRTCLVIREYNKPLLTRRLSHSVDSSALVLTLSCSVISQWHCSCAFQPEPPKLAGKWSCWRAKQPKLMRG